MFVTFGTGFLMGVLLVILAIKLMTRLDSTGCILLFGSLFFLFFWGLTVALWFLLTG